MLESLFTELAMVDPECEDIAIRLSKRLQTLNEDDLVITLNRVRAVLHEVSPFREEPVDLIQWVPSFKVRANDYNPNTVAPPEMKLLELSITADGYTQPIVTWQSGEINEVVDGFHRTRVGKESFAVRSRVHGYLPCVVANAARTDRNDRIAATIRHNRARGKHRVDSMSDIVVELKKRNWSDDKIAKELGMDADEILRLCQISGLAELFSDSEFSRSWDVEGHVSEDDFVGLSDDLSELDPEESKSFRTVNTSDEGRIFHTYEKWECYASGLYATTKDGMSRGECEEAYRVFLADLPRFEAALGYITTHWQNSCEHYLTNTAMNRIAWLGQASVAHAEGIPQVYRSGFGKLTEKQQEAANQMALTYLNRWLVANGRAEVTLEEAYSGERQVDIY